MPPPCADNQFASRGARPHCTGRAFQRETPCAAVGQPPAPPAAVDVVCDVVGAVRQDANGRSAADGPIWSKNPAFSTVNRCWMDRRSPQGGLRGWMWDG